MLNFCFCWPANRDTKQVSVNFWFLNLTYIKFISLFLIFVKRLLFINYKTVPKPNQKWVNFISLSLIAYTNGQIITFVDEFCIVPRLCDCPNTVLGTALSSILFEDIDAIEVCYYKNYYYIKCNTHSVREIRQLAPAPHGGCGLPTFMLRG